MSITDELRKEARGFGRYVYTAPQADCLTAIADRIDAEHEKAEQDLIDANNQMEQLCECSIRLPVDADGVPIHVGDVLTDGEYTFRVDELAAFGDGSWSIRNEDGNAWAACDVTHHHAPTVEDVLREMLEQAVGYSDAHTTVALNAIAEYAAKLRLADDGEEEW